MRDLARATLLASYIFSDVVKSDFMMYGWFVAESSELVCFYHDEDMMYQIIIVFGLCVRCRKRGQLPTSVCHISHCIRVDFRNLPF